MADSAPNLMQLLMQYMGGAQQGMPPGPSSPMQANPQQLGSQGVLGQGLAAQAQQIDQASGGQPPPPAQPQAPPSQSGPPPTQLAPMQPSPNIRPWAFTHLDPKDWTAEEHALFQAQHGINQHQPSQPLQQYLLSLMGIGSIAANQGQK